MFFFRVLFLLLQKTEKFLPSYETVSLAVKSVFQEFNWTSAEILATGKWKSKQRKNESLNGC